MTWTEIKRWAKDQGFDATKQKDDSINGASYYWSKSDDPPVSGVSISVSKCARDIFNSITDNQWIEHQTKYQISKEIDEYKID